MSNLVHNPISIDTYNKKDDKHSKNLVKNANGNEMVSLEAGLFSKTYLETRKTTTVNENHQFLYDSINIHFNILVFIEQFLIQLFPYIFILIGRANAYAHGYLSPVPIAILFNHIITISTYIMVLAYCMLPKELHGNQKYSDYSVVSGALWVPLLAVFMHRVMISVKYATLSPSEYKRVISSKSTQQGSNYQAQMQILTSWGPRSEIEHSYFEIGAAAIRAGVDISNKSFHIENPGKSKSALIQFNNWVKFAEKVLEYKGINVLERNEDGSYRISLADVGTAIMTNLSGQLFGGEFLVNLILFVTFFVVLMPLVYCNEHKLVSNWSYVLLAFATLIALIVYPVTFRFLTVSFVDGRRRCQEAIILADMLRLSDIQLSSFVDKLSHREVVASLLKKDDLPRLEYTTNKELDNGDANNETDNKQSARTKSVIINMFHFAQNEAEIPKVEFFDYGSGNLMSWVYLRLIFRYLGERFMFRISAYVLSSVTLVAILMASILVLLMTKSSTSAYSGMNSPVVLQCIATVFLFLIIIISSSAAGAMVNHRFALHLQILESHILYLEDRVSSGSTTEERDKQLLHSLDIAKHSIHLFNTLKPFLFLGIPASPGLVATFVSASISFGTTLFGIYFASRQSSSESGA